MSKFENKKNNKTSNKGPKPVKLELELVVTGRDFKGNEYDPESCKAIVAELQEAGCFDKLSVAVNISRDKIIEGSKGSMNIGRLQKYNTETEMIELLLIGKNAEHAEIIEHLVVVPRVRTTYGSTEVVTILGFDLVDPMEA